MRRYLASSLLLFVVGVLCLAQQPSSAFWQSRDSNYNKSIGGASGCSEATAFLARTSGLNATHQTNYTNLICGMVADTDYATLDVLYIWATDTTTNAILNVGSNAAYNASVIGTPASFTADVGYTGDGATFALNSNFNPFTATTPNYVLNSAGVGIYVQTNLALGGGFRAVGADSVGSMSIDPAFFGNTGYRVNTGSSKTAVAITSKGFWIPTRIAASGAGSTNLYLNGNTTAVDSDTAASDFVPRANIYFFADDNGGAANFSTLQMSAGFLGSGLSSAAMARIAARINTYMTAYGINVY